MKKAFIVSLCVGLFASSIAHGEDKKYETNIDKHKNEGTINTNKDGTLKAGVTELPKKPEVMQTEQDKRDAQQEKGGQVFIRKTFD